LGDALFYPKKYTEAINTTAIIINSKYAEAWNGKGNTLLMQGKNKEAIEAFNQP
jgi:hypothetical protein